MQPAIVKAKQAQDFLALVPQLVGFLPENSVVLVAFRGNRTCGALRFNLPDPTAPEKVHRRIATTLIGIVCKVKGADAVVPVVYTDDAFAGAADIPHRLFAGVLADRAQLSGFLVRDVLCVAADGWGSYLDPTCPAHGHPLDEIAASCVLDSVPDRRALATVHSGAALPRVDPAVKEKFARVFRRYSRLTESLGRPGLVELVDAILDPVETAEAALCWDAAELELDAAAGLLHLVQAPAHRDQMMLQFAFGRSIGEAAHALNLRYSAIQRITGKSMDEIVQAEHDRENAQFSADGAAETATDTDADRGVDVGVDVGADVGADPEEDAWPDSAARTRATNGLVADLMLGMTERRPDVDRVERAIAILKAVVAMAPKSARPAPLCMLAWLSWALGRGSVAGIFIDQALAVDSRYSMAGLLCTLFDSGHLPEWAYAAPEFENGPDAGRRTGPDAGAVR
ncbi:DUF4192 family protein [Glaciibacter sp. 2TAF33]|uniref:DUF4192 family protein n=1 Tax=Glaciibacter sp. 2TAF33 TaxID=3233015 RepID=UPI003F924874